MFVVSVVKIVRGALLFPDSDDSLDYDRIDKFVVSLVKGVR